MELNILCLKLKGDINVWLDLARVLTIIISFSGLSFSVIALIVSFRRDHLLVLSHTDQIRRIVIILVCLDIYILFCIYIVVSIYWGIIYLFVASTTIILSIILILRGQIRESKGILMVSFFLILFLSNCLVILY